MYDSNLWKYVNYNLIPKVWFFRTFSCTVTCPVRYIPTSRCPKAEKSTTESCFPPPSLRDLRGAIIVAGRKNFATEVKQSLEAEIKKRGRGRERTKRERERERERERDRETEGHRNRGGFPASTVIRVTTSLRDSVRSCRAAFLCSTVWTRLIINTRIRFWKSARPGCSGKGTFLNYGFG